MRTCLGKILAGAWACFAGFSCQAAIDDGLTFYCGYDGSADASFAAGNRKAERSASPEFRPGVRGQAVLVGGQPGGIIRALFYSPAKNFDLSAGTVSFWVKPLDWDGSSKGANVLVYSGDKKNYFQIYKFWSDNTFLFLRGEQDKWSRASDKMRNWERGQWRHIAAVWSAEELGLYVNGAMVCAEKTRFPLEIFPPLKPLCVGSGSPASGWDKSSIGESLVDELRVYDRPLGHDEIIELYLRDAEKAGLTGGLVTTGEKTPLLDGKISEFEYGFSGAGFSTARGFLSKDQGRWTISYDRENLYVGLVSSDTNPSGSDAGEIKKADRAEAFFITENEPETLWCLTFTPDGSAFVSRNDGTAIELSKLKIKNSVSGGIWTLEAAIPLSTFGMTGSPDGQNWKFNIGRVFAGQGEFVSAAPVVGRLSDRSHFLTLKFRPGAAQIQFAGWANLEKSISTLDVSANPGNPASEIKYISISDTQRLYGENMTVKSLFANGKSTPVRAPLPPQKNLWTLKDFSVNDTRIIEKTGGVESTLFQRRVVMECLNPLKVKFLCTLDKKRLSVSAIRRSDGKIRVSFLRPDQSCALQMSKSIPASSKYFDAVFDLDFTKLTPGEYKIIVDYIAPDGKASPVWEQAYSVPGKESPQFHKYVDIEADKVPEPWTPVKTDGGKVSVWGRTYDFSGGFLFSSLTSQGNEILAAPAALRADGETLPLSNSPALKKIQAGDMLAVYEKSAPLGDLSVESKVKVHFDGYCEIAMTVKPDGKPLNLKKLSLDIPLRGEFAELVRDSRLGPLENDKSGAAGDYWCQDIFNGRGYFFWVGNEKAGFNWLAPSLENWFCKNTAKSVEIIRTGDIATLRFNLIDSPFTLSAPRTIKWGFTLTPSRPLNRRILRLREAKDWEMWCQPWEYFAYPDYDRVDRSEIDRRLARNGMNPPEIFIYMGDGLTSPFSPEWAYWEQEWRVLSPGRAFGDWTGDFKDIRMRNLGVYVTACENSETFRNWLNHKRNEFFIRAKTPLRPQARGYYFDTGVGVCDCVNSNHGCDSAKWADATGKGHGLMLVDERRDLALNVYRMIKRTGPDAKIYAHQGWFRVMPMQHFAEIIVGGEGVEGLTTRDGNYFKILNPEMFRATFGPQIWGMKTIFINMVAREMPPERKLRFSLSNTNDRRDILHSYGYCVVHDVDMHAGLPEANKTLWSAQDKIGWNENVKFFPYWETDAVKLVSPMSNRILASAYSNGGKMLLAILNDTDKEENIKLCLDLKKLEVKSGLKGSDTWSPEKNYTLSGTFEDKIPAREFRMIVFDREK